MIERQRYLPETHYGRIRHKYLHSAICIFCLLLVFAARILCGATFTVTNVLDTNTPGTLRFAMNQSNANGLPDTIVFNIPGPGPHTIFPTMQLPILFDQAGVMIDGFTQPGSNPGPNPPSTATLMIIVNGINAGPSHGFWIFCSNNIIQGLVINNFEQDGIRIQASYSGTNNNFIYCNFIGTDQSGNIAQGNGQNQMRLWAGVDILCAPDTVGIAHNNIVISNLISANYAEGVSISNCPPGDVGFNIVTFNYIGTDVTGAVDLGNAHDGVYMGEGTHDNTIGTNLISGNDFEGVCIVGYAELGIYTFGNLVIDNIIGLDINLNPLGNTLDGVSIGQYGLFWYQGGYATDNVIDTNTIAHNGGNGVTVWEHQNDNINADHNRITRNFVYNNQLLGIDLGDNGVTLNDPGDPDTGPNEELNFPVITSAVFLAGQTTINGTINIDTDPTQAIVELFWVIPDPSGYGEGAQYLGVTNPDAAGNWVYVDPGILVIGDNVTATTIDLNSNTSEFAQNIAVISGIEENAAEVPDGHFLNQNVPNPFSSKTAIEYTLPRKTDVSLKVYDISGKFITSLVDGVHDSGHYVVYWDGRDNHGRQLSSGIYIYRIKTLEFNATKTLIITR